MAAISRRASRQNDSLSLADLLDRKREAEPQRESPKVQLYQQRENNALFTLIDRLCTQYTIQDRPVLTGTPDQRCLAIWDWFKSHCALDPQTQAPSYPYFQNIKKLDLSRSGLHMIPNLQYFPVEELNFSHNNLLERGGVGVSALPSSLTSLDLSYNGLTYLDDEHFGYNLRVLNLSHNELTHFSFCYSLKRLQVLDLSHNQLRRLPDSIHMIGKELVKRKFANPADAFLSGLASATHKWVHSLAHLLLNDNQLIVLPRSMDDLEALTHLDLSNNCLKARVHRMPKHFPKLTSRAETSHFNCIFGQQRDTPMTDSWKLATIALVVVMIYHVFMKDLEYVSDPKLAAKMTTKLITVLVGGALTYWTMRKISFF